MSCSNYCGVGGIILPANFEAKRDEQFSFCFTFGGGALCHC